MLSVVIKFDRCSILQLIIRSEIELSFNPLHESLNKLYLFLMATSQSFILFLKYINLFLFVRKQKSILIKTGLQLVNLGLHFSSFLLINPDMVVIIINNKLVFSVLLKQINFVPL